MEKTMNIGFAVEALNTLNKVTNATGKAGFAVYKAIRILSEETQDFNKVREDLVKKYGEDMGDGKIGIKEGSDGYQKFIEEINQMEKDKNQSIIKASDEAINYQKQLFEELEKYNTKEWYFHHFFGPEYEYKPKKQYKEVKHGYHYWELYQAYYV